MKAQKMTITIPAPKPRAKWLNDLLMSKRAARHSDDRNPSRRQMKADLKREVHSG